MTRHREPRQDSGFTLLELLIAMTLLGFLSVILFTGLRFGTRAWQHEEQRAGAMEEVRFAQSVLRDALSHIYPYYDAHDPLNSRVDFEGASHSMHFLAPARRALAPAGFMRVSLEAARIDSTSVLKIAEQHELAAAQAPDSSASDVLLDHIDSFSFSYFGSDAPGNAPQWFDTWSNRRILPLLIRVQIEFPVHDSRSWPELVVAPAISADVGCVLDPVTKYCRGR